MKALYLLASVLSHISTALEREVLERVWAESPGFADVACRLGRSEVDLEQLWRLLGDDCLDDAPEGLEG